MTWLIAQIWLLLLAAFAAGAAVGVWAAAARTGQRRAIAADFADAPPAPVREPGILLAAPDGQKDDLTQIIGIDPGTEDRLNSLGVFHLRQIAAWTAGEARWIEMRLNAPGRVVRERWMEQASAIG